MRLSRFVVEYVDTVQSALGRGDDTGADGLVNRVLLIDLPRLFVAEVDPVEVAQITGQVVLDADIRAEF